MVEKVEVHLPPSPAAGSATVIKGRSNVNPAEEDEGRGIE